MVQPSSYPTAPVNSDVDSHLVSMEFSELWKSAPAIGAATVAVAGALYKAIKTLLEFNDEYLSKRQFKRHSFLLGEAGQHPELRAFIEAVKREAIFRSTFGKPASPRMALAIMSLYESGRFSLEELRASSVYSKLGEDGSLIVVPGRAGNVVLWIAGLSIATMVVYAGILVLALIGVKTVLASLVALVVILLTCFLVWPFGRDARAVLLAKSVERKLAQISDRNLTAPSRGQTQATLESAAHGERSAS